MPKIHPETKVLIIKRLKIRFTADVADTVNVSQRQVQRIKKDLKRLETFLTSPGQADPARQLLERTVCWLENPRPAHFPLQQSSTRPGQLKSLCLSDSVSKRPPWSNQCPEASTKQKTIEKPCGICQGLQPAKRMDAGKVAGGGFFR
ncbi:hypothetical protein QQF64_018320 [Cirrhinus molitorella]|uniref:Uncharacterized protein n=1 Tax=Cirrhinus molitorella TaxID=172907 RepID=A0ABR3LFQ4_9TELE